MNMRRFVVVMLGMALAAVNLAAPVEVLVGVPKLAKSELQAKIGKLGAVGSPNGEGFYTVKLSKGVTRSKLEALLGSENVHPLWATRVNKNSLVSVQSRIHYLRNVARLKGLSGEGEESGVDFYEALEYFLESRVGPDGLLDMAAMESALQQRDQLPIAHFDTGEGNAPSGSFSFIGPKNLDIPYQRYYGTPPLSGRVNGIDFDKADPSVVYLATAGGGVWKSTNGGTSWSFKSSGWKSLGTTSVSVHPTNPNIVIVGTGDAFAGWDVPFGIMRSTDGGSTWTNVGTAQFGTNNVTRVLFHPDNGNIAIALTGGSTGDIWRSTDAGATWTATNAPSGQWDDIDFNITSGGSRALWAVGGGSSNKIYRSTNLGSTWSSVASSPTGTTQGIMDVACSRVTAGKAWVICPNNNTIFRTTTSGSSWTNLAPSAATGFPMALGSDPTYNWSQDGYDIHLNCGRYNNADVLYCGLISLALSNDSGNTWFDIGESFQSTSELHNDQHCMATFPGNSPYSYVGCDGGIFLMTYIPGLINSFSPKNNSVYDTQFYHMSVHPTNSAYVMGGTQDNASPASRGNLSSWKNLQGGDGAWSGFDQNSPGIHYTSSQFGAIFRYTTTTDTSGDIISPVDANGNVTWSAKFIAPLVLGSGGSTVIAGADSRIKRWTGVAGVWTSSASCGSPVRTLTVGQSNSNRIYAGCDDGSLWHSADGGVTINKIDSTLPNAAIGSVATNWTNSGDILVGLLGTSGGLYRSTNAATVASPTWTNVSGSGATALPASPVNTVMRDPFNTSCWYVGTDVGAFMTTNSGTTWTNMNPLGFGNVKVNCFAISPAKDYLYAATFGRGIWRIALTNRTFTAFTAAATTLFGNRSTTATMTLSSGASIGTTAVLSSSNVYVTVPSTVTFTSGATTKSFTVNTVQAFGTNKTTTVTATCLGTSRAITFTIKPYPTVSSYLLSKTSIYGGTAVVGTATLSAGAPYSGSISFTDTSASVTSPGATAISAGTVSKAVSIPTVKVAVVTSATLQATYMGTFKTATLTLRPFPTITSFVFNPNPVYDGFSTTATVTLSSAVIIATQIGISESSPLVTTTTPLNMVIGQSTLTFPVSAIPVGAASTVPITARVVGDTVPAILTNLTIKPMKLVSLTLTTNPIQGGLTTPFRVTLNEPAVTGGARAICSSDRPEAMPDSVVPIPAGSLFGDGSVHTASVNVSTTCVISASYNGSIVRNTLTITP